MRKWRRVSATHPPVGHSFGHGAAHYDVSVTIGSDRLFPAIEAADGDRATDHPR